MKKAILAYVPVLHQGYLNFFMKHSLFYESLFILGEEIVKSFDQLRKDIRALNPMWIERAVGSWTMFKEIQIAGHNDLLELAEQNPKIVMPDEDVSHEVTNRYFKGCQIRFDSVFLRWDRTKTLTEKMVEADQVISQEEFDRKIMSIAEVEAKKSSDWWRHIGAVLVKANKVVLVAHNRHVPSEHMPYVFGDPRANFKRGIHIELSTSLHAEAGIIAEAARSGVSSEGASLYVTTFPCPPCAKLIAYSGITRLYFKEGYSMVDAQNILNSRGIRIFLVK